MYYLTIFVAWNIAIALFTYAGDLVGFHRLLSLAANLTVGIIGIILCYRVNQSGDNKDFIPRMICLSWPVCVQLVVIVSALSIVPALLSASLGHESLSTTPDKLWASWSQSWSTPFLYLICYYWILYGLIAQIAHPEAAKKVVQETGKRWSGEEIALAVLGAIGVLVVMGPLLVMGLALGIPEPFNFVFSGAVMLILVWLIFRLLRWGEGARRSRRFITGQITTVSRDPPALFSELMEHRNRIN